MWRAKKDEMESFIENLENDAEIFDFNELTLDEKFYEEIGEDRKKLEENPPWAPEASDPKGNYENFNEYINSRSDIPEYIKKDLIDARYFGPPVIMVAGFRIEELAIVRQMIDKFLGKDVKLIPIAGREVLNSKVEDALYLPEPKWEEPRPRGARTGTWGSQRTIVFGGISMEDQAVIVEVMEESGLPPVCVAIASERTRGMKLGELLANAIKLQRDRKNPEEQLWDSEERLVNNAYDLNDYYAEKIEDRIEVVQKGLQSGEAQLIRDPETGILKVEMDGLDDEIFDPEKISEPVNSENSSYPTSSRATTSKTSPPKVTGTNPPRLKKKSKSPKAAAKETLADERDVVPRKEKTDEDYFAIDDLVCEELNLDKEHRPGFDSDDKNSGPYSEAEYRKPEKDAPRMNVPDSGRVFPLSTEPKSIGNGMTQNTVFNGVVPDPVNFMKINFGYDVKQGGFTPPTQEELEATSYRNPTVDDESFQSDENEAPSVEELIQKATAKGIDLEQLNSIIDALPGDEEKE